MANAPAAAAGGDLGAARTLPMAAGSLSPAVVGFLSEGGFRPAFWLLVATSAGATVLAVGLWLGDR